MSGPIIVGLTGKPGCGKDSRVERLLEIAEEKEGLNIIPSFTSIGVGDLVRGALSDSSHYLHHSMKEFFAEAGPAALAPNEFILPLLSEQLDMYKKSKWGILVVNGMTRDEDQNSYLDQLIAHETDDAVVKQRIGNRLDLGYQGFVTHLGLNGSAPTHDELRAAINQRSGEGYRLFTEYNSATKENPHLPKLRADDLFHDQRLEIFYQKTQPAIDAFNSDAKYLVQGKSEIELDMPAYVQILNKIGA